MLPEIEQESTLYDANNNGEQNGKQVEEQVVEQSKKQGKKQVEKRAKLTKRDYLMALVGCLCFALYFAIGLTFLIVAIIGSIEN